MIADRRRRDQEQADAARRAEEERATRLANGIAAARQALSAGRLDEARHLLAPLARDFPSNDEVQSVLDVVRWQAQQLVVGPAQETLREVRGRTLRVEPERAVGRLAGIQISGLPEDLARQVFEAWSNACYHLVQQRGWHEPRRYSPATSRGVVLARRTADRPYEVVSALGMMPDWRVGDVVTASGGPGRRPPAASAVTSSTSVLGRSRGNRPCSRERARRAGPSPNARSPGPPCLHHPLA